MFPQNRAVYARSLSTKFIRKPALRIAVDVVLETVASSVINKDAFSDSLDFDLEL